VFVPFALLGSCGLVLAPFAANVGKIKLCGVAPDFTVRGPISYVQTIAGTVTGGHPNARMIPDRNHN
jgi:hypothetical protein